MEYCLLAHILSFGTLFPMKTELRLRMSQNRAPKIILELKKEEPENKILYDIM